MESPVRGHVFAEYWVQCGVCEREAVLDARKRRIAVEEVRERGWKHTHNHGWVCPGCNERNR